MPEFHYKDTVYTYHMSGEGIPIVFIHPPAMGRIVFRYQQQLDRFLKIIIPDLSGNGDTKGPEKDISIPLLADEVRELLDHIQVEKAVICGYSAGGSVAQEFVLNHPDKALGLILISGYSEVISTGFKYEHIAGMYLVKRFPAFLRYLISLSHTDDHSFRREIQSHMNKANKRMWLQFYEESLTYSCTEQLSDISCPVLLMYGSQDFTNQHLRTYQHINHEVVIFPSVSHQLPTKSWQSVNQNITGFIMNRIQPSH